MAGTFRFPEELKREATEYARKAGVSLNALCALALLDYLNARKPGFVGALQPPARGVEVPEQGGSASGVFVEASPLHQGAKSVAGVPVASQVEGSLGGQGHQVDRVSWAEVLKAAVPPVKRKKNRRKR